MLGKKLIRINTDTKKVQVMKRFELKLEDELFTLLTKNCEKGEVSEFIRNAVTEKLSRKKESDTEALDVFKFMQKMDPESMLKKLIDQELVSQFIYEELKKQNEILKLILRRSALASALSGAILKEQDEDLINQTQNTVIDLVDSEIQKLLSK